MDLGHPSLSSFAGPAPSDRLALGPTILLALRDIGIHLNPHRCRALWPPFGEPATFEHADHDADPDYGARIARALS